MKPGVSTICIVGLDYIPKSLHSTMPHCLVSECIALDSLNRFGYSQRILQSVLLPAPVLPKTMMVFGLFIEEIKLIKVNFRH
jgi:hypothetical protein